jgi:hypothetical protein
VNVPMFSGSYCHSRGNRRRSNMGGSKSEA